MKCLSRVLLALSCLLTPPGLLAAEGLDEVAVAAGDRDQVTVLIWEEFLSKRLVKALRNKHNLKVNLIEFSDPDEREALMKEKHAEIDIVDVDTIWTSEYKRRGLIEKLDITRIPNLRHMMTRWRTDPDYAVPYLWGYTGIAWRTDLVKEPPKSYADLFALAQQMPGKVSLLDDAHEALRAALYAFGKKPWAMNTPAEVKATAKLLKPRLKDFRIVGSEVTDKSPWATGGIVAGQAYNGDIAYLRDNGKVPLAFAVPSPGCMIWQEQLAILRESKNKDAAYRFLNLINDPQLAARNAVEVRFATSNALAASNLPKEFRDDPVIRPTFEGTEGCYFYNAFDQPTQNAIRAVRLE